MQLWIIGVINGRRVQSFKRIAENFGYTVQLFSYQQFIEAPLIDTRIPTTIRVESPGEDFNTDKYLLTQGISADMISEHHIKQLKFDKGIIQYTKQWYLGWQIILQHIEEKVRHAKNMSFMNKPHAIAMMFDKLKCQKHLFNHGISIPQNLGRIDSYDHLQALVKRHRLGRLFIKPLYGSSASGVMAYQTNSSGKASIISSIELDQSTDSPCLYNNLKLKRYNNLHDIKTIINMMSHNAIFAEAWIPKKSAQNMVSDVRVLVINYRACHFVLRKSTTPITNIHLGNSKAGINEAIALWGQELVDQITLTAQNAAQTLSGVFYCGIDIAVGTNNRPYVLEINAFGDLLLGVKHQGLDPYQRQLSEWQMVHKIGKIH